MHNFTMYKYTNNNKLYKIVKLYGMYYNITKVTIINIFNNHFYTLKY